MPVTSFELDTIQDVRYIDQLLSRSKLQIGLYDSGTWMLYYNSPCRFLDRQSSKCAIHDSPRQPFICKQYSARSCWYRTAFASTESRNFIRFDRTRFAWLADCFTYGGDGAIADTPGWERMIEELGRIPLREEPEFQQENCVFPQPARPESAGTLRFPSAAGRLQAGWFPEDTAAEVFIPLNVPKTLVNLEFIKFRLGFPGHSLWRFRGTDGSSLSRRRSVMPHSETVKGFKPPAQCRNTPIANGKT